MTPIGHCHLSYFHKYRMAVVQIDDALVYLAMLRDLDENDEEAKAAIVEFINQKGLRRCRKPDDYDSRDWARALDIYASQQRETKSRHLLFPVAPLALSTQWWLWEMKPKLAMRYEALLRAAQTNPCVATFDDYNDFIAVHGLRKRPISDEHTDDIAKKLDRIRRIQLQRDINGELDNPFSL